MHSSRAAFSSLHTQHGYRRKGVSQEPRGKTNRKVTDLYGWGVVLGLLLELRGDGFGCGGGLCWRRGMLEVAWNGDGEAYWVTRW